jgi:tetratricopeptide (TPR) repeat protein
LHRDFLVEVALAAVGQHVVELEDLTAYYEGRITTAEREKLQEHLSRCVRCSVLLRELHEFASDSGERGLTGPEHLEREAWEALQRGRSLPLYGLIHLWEAAGVAADPALSDEALVLAPPEVKVRILVKKALTLQESGEPELALKTLSEAEPFVSGLNEPRLLLCLRYNFAATLCDLGRFMEAQRRMSEITALAAETGNELDPVRVLWLRCRIDSGLGRAPEAEAAFKQVRQAFRQRGIAYADDFATVTLELALLLSEQGRWSEVRSLAMETTWIFKTQGIHSEAEKALTFFCEMAATERLTVELAKSILEYLNRAEKPPGPL